MKTIDEYIDQRNEIQFRAEAVDEEFADLIWQKLGVANRHINRVVEGVLSLTPAVTQEIEDCLERAAQMVVARTEGGSGVA